MTENTGESYRESGTDVIIALATPDEVAYAELVDEFGVELIDDDLGNVVKDRVRALYDSRDTIRQQLEQSQGASQ